METLNYLLKVNVAFALALIPYGLWMRKETFFNLNRAWLLGAAFVAFVIPLLPSLTVPVIGGVIELPVIAPSPSAEVAGSGLSWSLLVPVYFTVMAVFLLKLLVDVLKVTRAARSEQGTGAWSFLGTIVLPAGLTEEERNAIHRHEQVHVDQWHSLDVILFRVLQAISWPAPTWTWTLRELRAVHEYAADAIASKRSPEYTTILLSQALGLPMASLVHSFHSSNLKTRTQMLKRSPSSKTALVKYLLAAPFVLSMAFVTSDGRSATPVRMERNAINEPEQQPEFPGGMEALMKYMGANLKYPKAAAANGEEGTVYVAYMVKADGSVSDVAVARGVSAELDAEAVRVVKAMPRWTPGSKDGKPANVKMTLPVKFQLDSTK